MRFGGISIPDHRIHDPHVVRNSLKQVMFRLEDDFSKGRIKDLARYNRLMAECKDIYWRL
jgi:hypothetical protein